jgi:CheY-like chemotaxis protein
MFLSAATPESSVDLTRYICGYEGTRRRIVLIDDDPTHVDFMSTLLAPLGFELRCASTGRAGLELLAASLPDLLLVDISMPDMTGWQVIEQLRRIPQSAAVRVLVVSANAHEYTPGGHDRAHDGFIMKPVDVALLLDAIRTVLKLTWHYSDDVPRSDPSQPAANVVAGTARHHFDDLWQLGLIGHVRGIQAKLREIEADDPANRAFVTSLKTMVDGFQMGRYMATLKAIREDA